MFCTSCGTQLPPGAMACPNCGAAVAFPATSTGPLPVINNHLVPSILVTLCCCLPIGIVAIIYAAQVNSKLAMGDVAGAQMSANSAKMWCWIGLGTGLVLGIGYGILTGLASLGGH